MREDRKEQTVEGSRRQRASRRRGGKRLAPAPPSRHQLPLYLLPAALAFLAVALLTAQITLYCDDFMYATFFREGLGGFWELTKWHYTAFNGRVFVHFAAQVALLFGTKLFVLLHPAMLLWCFLWGLKLQSPGVDRPRRLMAAPVGVMAMAALPLPYMRECLLWMSASFNYIFPLCVILPTLWLFTREGKGEKAYAALLVLSFLSGATTEQSGLAAIVALGLWGLLAFLRGKETLLRGLLPGLLAAVGYCTILLAPGTWVRIGNETGGGLLQILEPSVLEYRFRHCLTYFSGQSGLHLLIAGVMVLTALHGLMKGQKLLLAGLPAAVGYLLLCRLGSELWYDLLAVVWFLFAAAVYLRREETTLRALLLLGMLSTQLVMMATSTVGYRTAVPAIFLLLVVGISLLCECLELLPLWGNGLTCAALLGVCFALFLPTFQGYAKNGSIHRANEAQLRDQSDPLAVIDLSADPEYGYTMFYVSSTFLEPAKIYYRAEDKALSYAPGDRYAGLSNGEEYGLPVVLDEETGEPNFPIVNTILFCGGEAGWNSTLRGTEATLNGVRCLFRPNGTTMLLAPQGDEAVGEAFYTHVTMPWYTYYVSGGALRELFGITWSYDGEENIYYVGID